MSEADDRVNEAANMIRDDVVMTRGHDRSDEIRMAKVIAIANAAGWNGVENPKDLFEFLKQRLSDTETIENLISERDELLAAAKQAVATHKELAKLGFGVPESERKSMAALSAAIAKATTPP